MSNSRLELSCFKSILKKLLVMILLKTIKGFYKEQPQSQNLVSRKLKKHPVKVARLGEVECKTTSRLELSHTTAT